MAGKGSNAKAAPTKAPAAKRAAKATGAPDRPVREPKAAKAKASVGAKPVVDAAQPVTSPPEAHPEVVAKMGADTERGLHGVEVDDTPNENYTVAGVTSGKPTPESTRKAGERVPVKALEDGKVVNK